MKRVITALIAVAIAAAIAAPPVLAAEPPAKPLLTLTSLASPTAFAPGDTEHDQTYDLRVANLGAEATDGSDITITDTLPAGLIVKAVNLGLRSTRPGSLGGVYDYAPEACATEVVGEAEKLTCTISEGLFEASEPATLFPGEERRILIHVLVPASVPKGQTLTNHVEVQGGGPAPTSIDVDNETATEVEGKLQPAPAGLAIFHADLSGPDGQAVGQAGAHPFQFTVGFAVNTKLPPPGSDLKFVPAGGDVKEIRTTVPPGLIGNPLATKRCSAQDFSTQHFIDLVLPGGGTGFYKANDCPQGSAVGMALVQEIEGEADIIPVPIYNLVPPPGMPAQLGMQILGVPFYLGAEVRPDHRYEIVAPLRNLSQAKRLVAATVVLWGDPSDPRHNPLRGSCLNELAARLPISRCSAPPEGEARPFLRLPTNCESPLEITMEIETWSLISFGQSAPHPAPSGCNQLKFEPKLPRARPTTDVADSPTGLEVDVNLPQNEDPKGLGSADLRKAVVTLPEGLVLNPSAANGLAACSEAQIGYLGKDQGAESFSDEPAHCPPASRIGEVEVDTPLLDHPLPGSVYVAAPGANPFNNLTAIYIAVHDPATGVIVKLAGKAEPDPATGQLRTTFAENPQTPFEDFKVKLFGGPAAALRTPAVCGTYSTTSVMTPWSAPESGPPATPADTYPIDLSPGGGPCPTSPGGEPNSPGFQAGTIAPIAGATTPMTIRLSRADGSQEFGSVTLTPPPGLLARLAAIPYCSEADLASAASRSGAAERANPSCPAPSRLGTVDVAAGAGPAPYWTQGTAYLAGPYKGGPFSLAIITPAAAGPYDLGTVVVRTAIHIDPETTRITATSDPLPRILQGIPLDVREVLVRLDHPGWGLNPTNCNPFTFGGQLISTLGQAAALQRPFQVGECGRLPFKPQLRLRLKGETKRAENPKLIATLKAKAGEANIARTSVKLPRSAFLDQSHIRTICTRVQFAADACPKGSIYGRATATTPLFDYPVSGNVYLRSSNHNLPDLVIDLRGPERQPIHVDLVGRTDSVKGALRNTFDFVPDAPVSTFRLELFGGKRGLVVNSRNLCAHDYRATVKLDGQNGKTFDTEPLVGNDCPGDHKRHGHHGRH